MNDKELLELAAKAAGVDAEALEDYSDSEGLWLKGERTADNNKFWNPLADDGDALRLAVKLELDVWFEGVGHVKSVGLLGEVQEVKLNEDPYEATRRAITRAAAEIGRSMP